MEQRKIIFLDVDGTLVDYSGHIPQSAAEAEKNTRVWVSKRLGSRYHSSPDCPLVIKPKEMTRQEAEDEGYTSCDWCW